MDNGLVFKLGMMEHDGFAFLVVKGWSLLQLEGTLAVFEVIFTSQSDIFQ